MLAECTLEYFPSATKIAFFWQVFTVPFDYIKAEAENPRPRLRLLHPYAEHLAQSFARFVMRVGLPQDIPEFENPRKGSR